MKKITIINGPNLNLLGTREPDIYGSETFENFFAQLLVKFTDQVQLYYFQSNYEGGIIDKLHEVGFSHDGIVLNGGAYTHTSIAIADAIGAISSPVIEVHISNIHSRETFRQHSFSAANAIGVIAGLGFNGYDLAIRHILDLK